MSVDSVGGDHIDLVRHERGVRRSWRSREQEASVVGALAKHSGAWERDQQRIRDEASSAAGAVAAKTHSGVREGQDAHPIQNWCQGSARRGTWS